MSDAVNALVQTVDSETQRPVLLAATNIGLYRSFDPDQGLAEVATTAQDWIRVPRCISDGSRSIRKRSLAGTAASGVLFLAMAENRGSVCQVFPPKHRSTRLRVDPQRPNYIYVGTKQAFYMSQDGGATWSRRGGNLPFGDFTSILINPRNTDEIFVGNAYQTGEIGGGVYRTMNAGTTWARIDPKENRLPSQRIWALAFDSRRSKHALRWFSFGGCLCRSARSRIVSSATSQ